MTEERNRGTSADVEKLLTPEEVAAYLRINEQTVRRYLRDGQLKGYLVGRIWRVPESAVQRWLENLPPPAEKEKKG